MNILEMIGTLVVIVHPQSLVALTIPVIVVACGAISLPPYLLYLFDKRSSRIQMCTKRRNYYHSIGREDLVAEEEKKRKKLLALAQ